MIPQFNSTELLLLAHDEWKHRQERKHLDDEAAWVTGFIEGFITDKNWARDKVDNILLTLTPRHSKSHDLIQLQIKSDQCKPIKVQQYERD